MPWWHHRASRFFPSSGSPSSTPWLCPQVCSPLVTGWQQQLQVLYPKLAASRNRKGDHPHSCVFKGEETILRSLLRDFPSHHISQNRITVTHLNQYCQSWEWAPHDWLRPIRTRAMAGPWAGPSLPWSTWPEEEHGYLNRMWVLSGKGKGGNRS